jgi:hypothetical protein
MHTWQVPDTITNQKINHTNDTLSVFLAPIIGTCGQVLDESHPLSNFDLLFFRELTSLAGDIGRRVVHLSIFLLVRLLFKLFSGI